MRPFPARLLLLVFACLVPGVVFAGDPCDGQGDADLALIVENPPAVGGVFSMSLAGLPFAPFSVIADVGPGPSTVPGVGTFCLDLGPRKKILIDGIRQGVPILPVSGVFEFGLQVPRDPGLAGRTFYIQAAILDPMAPNGVAISNMVSLTVLPSLVEDFTTTDRKDGETTTAIWEGNGKLKGVVSTTPRISEYSPVESQFNIPHPLVEVGNPTTPFGCRFMMKFRTYEVGAAPGESILGMSWSPRSNFLFASTYRDLSMKLGRFPFPDGGSLGFFYHENYDETGPVTVFEGDYTVGNNSDIRWVPWPEFGTDYELDSSFPLLFEVEIPEGGDTYQLFRNQYIGQVPRSRLFSNAGEERASIVSEATTYRTQFVLVQNRAFGQSTFFDTGLEDPDYYPPRIKIGVLPEGTRVTAAYEGADDLDGDGLPDPDTFTGFRDDVHDLDGFRFLRFRVTLKGNHETGGVAHVGFLAIPFSE